MKTKRIIRPCPNCDCTNPEVYSSSNPWDDYIVICPVCGFSYSECGGYGDSDQEAIEVWNYGVEHWGVNNKL